MKTIYQTPNQEIMVLYSGTFLQASLGPLEEKEHEFNWEEEQL